jgi:hypothetical protein
MNRRFGRTYRLHFHRNKSVFPEDGNIKVNRGFVNQEYPEHLEYERNKHNSMEHGFLCLNVYSLM